MSPKSSGSITDRTAALSLHTRVLTGHLTDEQIKIDGDKNETVVGAR